MRKFLFLFLIWSITAAHADSQMEVLGKELLRGQQLMLERDYPSTLRLFQELQTKYPRSPGGFFGEMAIYQLQMFERDDFHREEAFFDAMRRGAPAVTHVMQNPQSDALDLLLCASTNGLHAFHMARRHKWVKAYTLITQSRQTLRRIRNIDPSFIDPDLGLALYYYWRSFFRDRLGPLKLFFPDRRGEALAMIRRVSTEGWLAKDLASLNLAVISFVENRAEDTKTVFLSYLKRYPKNLVIRNFLGRESLREKQYADAVIQFRKALEVDSGYKQARYFIAAGLLLQENPSLLDEVERELGLFDKQNTDPVWKSYVHYWRGEISVRRGLTAEAEKEHQNAIALNRKMKEASFQIGLVGGGF